MVEQTAGYNLTALRVTRFVRNPDGTFTIEWVGGGTLQISESLTDGWHDVRGAASPYTFPSSVPRLLLRIRR
jgi:hypothetical protein